MPRSLLDNFVTIEDLYRYIVDNCNDQRRVEIQHTGIKIVKRQMVKEREMYRTMYLPFSQNKVGSI